MYIKCDVHTYMHTYLVIKAASLFDILKAQSALHIVKNLSIPTRDVQYF